MLKIINKNRISRQNFNKIKAETQVVTGSSTGLRIIIKDSNFVIRNLELQWGFVMKDC